MKKIGILWFVVLLLHVTAFAKTTDIEIKKGSVLAYSVREGSKSFIYTITIKEWDIDNRKISFSWQTNEKPVARKGGYSLARYNSITSDEFLVGIGKTGTEEQLTDDQTFVVAPAYLNDYLADEDEEGDFTIFENGKKYPITSSEAEIKDFQEKALKYNGVAIMGGYTHIIPSAKTPELGFLQESTNDKYILAYYRSATLTMDILSITTPVETASSKLSLPPLLKTKPVTKTMDPAKMAAVKKSFPMLAAVETYDVTDGGKDPKPFDETYDFRQTSGAGNPPSAIDCFTADLQIIYKQKKNYGLADMTETLDKKSLPASAAQKLLKVYLDKEARSIPGYKPWTHWKFVRKLNESQRYQLALDLEGYIKQYGFTE